ncbi:unnamed protein product [Cylicocyclus nassatus]|uniref:Uncharacterized protein n=1 Tax=Cylicocyclus nassatus TaxID=53992 RepID=A0AA36GUL9_CYLNA|nr:unnamed protein product [Cylicocyclus nassatus]
MLMHVASDQLIASLAILVSHCYISSPLPLKNKTTTLTKVDNVSKSMLKENSIFTSIVRKERQKRRVTVLVKRSNMSDNQTLLDSTRPTRPTQKARVKAGEKDTTLGLPESSNHSESDTSASTTEESTLYGVKWMKWQKYLADQQLFLPIHIPHIDGNLLLRLLKDSESAKRKTATGPTPVHNEYTEPSLFISLAFLILIGATTILCQRMRSIDFVRNPSIKYTRTVNNDAKSQLTKAKASLPNIAGMKGAYGRGKLTEITDVFDNLVRPSHLLLDGTSFATEIHAKGRQMHMRIKLLTAEELAREEI